MLEVQLMSIMSVRTKTNQIQAKSLHRRSSEEEELSRIRWSGATQSRAEQSSKLSVKPRRGRHCER